MKRVKKYQALHFGTYGTIMPFLGFQTLNVLIDNLNVLQLVLLTYWFSITY